MSPATVCAVGNAKIGEKDGKGGCEESVMVVVARRVGRRQLAAAGRFEREN